MLIFYNCYSTVTMSSKNQFETTLEKLTSVKGAKKLQNGHFVDLPYCPYCKKHVASLMQCLKENH